MIHNWIHSLSVQSYICNLAILLMKRNLNFTRSQNVEAIKNTNRFIHSKIRYVT